MICWAKRPFSTVPRRDCQVHTGHAEQVSGTPETVNTDGNLHNHKIRQALNTVHTDLNG